MLNNMLANLLRISFLSNFNPINPRLFRVRVGLWGLPFCPWLISLDRCFDATAQQICQSKIGFGVRF